jgi:hypothetical protein
MKPICLDLPGLVKNQLIADILHKDRYKFVWCKKGAIRLNTWTKLFRTEVVGTNENHIYIIRILSNICIVISGSSKQGIHLSWSCSFLLLVVYAVLVTSLIAKTVNISCCSKRVVFVFPSFAQRGTA